MQKKGLGRGLGALISAAESPQEPAESAVDVDRIAPNPFQPRRGFDAEKIAELAASIREHGVIQPLVVRRSANGDYELVAGERRLRAAKQAGLQQVPVVVREAADDAALALALIENLQREDLNAIEEAEGYKRLQEDFGLSQEEIADKVGKSRPAVANTLRLLNLPQLVRDDIAAGRLAAGQARALLALSSEAAIVAAAREVIAKGLTARAAEKLAARMKTGGRKRQPAALDADVRAVIERLQRSLGTKVRFVPARGGRGKIEIEYYSAAELDRLIERLAAN
ncbi:MAG TPA: ParB/RepB/Spo0J family partition protein [Candidatus Binatia bacterium]|nr:ParB/RepB/Spo0J family partition protein [Candidatus Binatia bacterium]